MDRYGTAVIRTTTQVVQTNRGLLRSNPSKMHAVVTPDTSVTPASASIRCYVGGIGARAAGGLGTRAQPNIGSVARSAYGFRGMPSIMGYGDRRLMGSVTIEGGKDEKTAKENEVEGDVGLALDDTQRQAEEEEEKKQGGSDSDSLSDDSNSSFSDDDEEEERSTSSSSEIGLEQKQGSKSPRPSSPKTPTEPSSSSSPFLRGPRRVPLPIAYETVEVATPLNTIAELQAVLKSKVIPRFQNSSDARTRKFIQGHGLWPLFIGPTVVKLVQRRELAQRDSYGSEDHKDPELGHGQHQDHGYDRDHRGSNQQGGTGWHPEVKAQRYTLVESITGLTCRLPYTVSNTAYFAESQGFLALLNLSSYATERDVEQLIGGWGSFGVEPIDIIPLIGVREALLQGGFYIRVRNLQEIDSIKHKLNEVRYANETLRCFDAISESQVLQRLAELPDFNYFEDRTLVFHKVPDNFPLTSLYHMFSSFAIEDMFVDFRPRKALHYVTIKFADVEECKAAWRSVKSPIQLLKSEIHMSYGVRTLDPNLWFNNIQIEALRPSNQRSERDKSTRGRSRSSSNANPEQVKDEQMGGQ